jgi:hypothetical protein
MTLATDWSKHSPTHRSQAQRVSHLSSLMKAVQRKTSESEHVQETKTSLSTHNPTLSVLILLFIYGMTQVFSQFHVISYFRNAQTGRSCLSSGILTFLEVDRTWHYPGTCKGLEKFTYISARECFVAQNSSIFFIGNSVSRRLLYTVAHIIGGPNATVTTNMHAVERIQDKGSHSIFEVELDSSGRCSDQRTCATSAFNLNDGATRLNSSALAGLNCANKTAWDTMRSITPGPSCHLGYIYTATPVIASTEALINGWLDLMQNDGLEFQASPADNYDVFVFQVTLITEEDIEKMEGLVSALQKLVKLREGRQPVKVILWGSPITLNPKLNVSTIEQVLHEATSESHLSFLRDKVMFVDVTDATRQAVTRGFGHITENSAQHFGGFTRLMIADNILNAIKLLLIE